MNRIIFYLLSFILIIIPIILQSSCEIDEPLPPPECEVRDLEIELAFSTNHYTERRTSNLCLNIPVANSNPCTSSNVNEIVGLNILSAAVIPPSPSEYWCNIRVDADCANYPLFYAWLQTDVNSNSCTKTIPIPDNEESTVTVTFTETCETCNRNVNGGCNYSREIFKNVSPLFGNESNLYVELVYDFSDCSTTSNCN